MRIALTTDLQLPAQQNPLGRELEILVVGKAELAVDIHAIQRRRADVEDDVQTRADRNYVTFLRKRPSGPRSWIGPRPCLDRRRTLALRRGLLVRRGVLLGVGAGA